MLCVLNGHHDKMGDGRLVQDTHASRLQRPLDCCIQTLWTAQRAAQLAVALRWCMGLFCVCAAVACMCVMAPPVAALEQPQGVVLWVLQSAPRHCDKLPIHQQGGSVRACVCTRVLSSVQGVNLRAASTALGSRGSLLLIRCSTMPHAHAWADPLCGVASIM